VAGVSSVLAIGAGILTNEATSGGRGRWYRAGGAERRLGRVRHTARDAPIAELSCRDGPSAAVVDGTAWRRSRALRGLLARRVEVVRSRASTDDDD
jgi:hypothetical protein